MPMFCLQRNPLSVAGWNTRRHQSLPIQSASIQYGKWRMKYAVLKKWCRFAKSNPADTFIILTESGMMHRLTRELPDKSFVAGPTGHCACNDCRFMKMNTLPKLLDCLKLGSPEITMNDDLIEKAKAPIQRMLEWS